MATAMTTAERVALMRQRRQKAGLVRLEIYARPEHHAAFKVIANALVQGREYPDQAKGHATTIRSAAKHMIEEMQS